MLSKRIDWVLFFATLPLLGAGLVTMYSFSGSVSAEAYFFERQLVWIAVALGMFFAFSQLDWRFLKRGGLLLALYAGSLVALAGLLISGESVRGAESWISFGIFSIQPVVFTKLLLVLILAKYFSRRHVEIAHIKHIVISGLFALIPFLLVLMQPDFGSALIIFFIWLGMVMISGVSKKHLVLVFLLAAASSLLLWAFIFTDTQKDRIVSFLYPLEDIQGAGYNAYQAKIAVGSGGLFGKGIGYGTQSRLEFLPEYETDFIFAAFAEEWGFFGVLLLFTLFCTVFWRILTNAYRGATNFEMLFGGGIAVIMACHFFIHVGMNVGLLPITGLTLPFLSYGGSHLVGTYMGLGILMGMRAYARVAHPERVESREIMGLEAV